MGEINKKFDGVLWERKGRRDIRKLKPICPKCHYELDIITELQEMKQKLNEDGCLSFTIPNPHVSYSCPKCSFSRITSIDNVGNPMDLRKVALKEFEYRQRLKKSKSENTKD